MTLLHIIIVSVNLDSKKEQSSQPETFIIKLSNRLSLRLAGQLPTICILALCQKKPIDRGAEQLLAADNNDRKIAVELKSFIRKSRIANLEQALGQALVN
ncbi:element excision factor XisH family protein [Microcoleus sp. BROC3]|uniref:element excision factor XisH family protein n=1 Tax=Microcoleus sp. BROC3 TaxID=3055323 RepID=UPI002FD5F1F5